MWSPAGDRSSGLNFGIHFSGFLGNLCCFPGKNNAHFSIQGLFNWLAIGSSSDEEGFEDVLLYEESSDGD